MHFLHLLLTSVLLLLCAGCDAESSTEATVRLGYFSNLTHAGAIVGFAKGFFQEELGAEATLQTSTFNAGPSAVEALFADALDATFVGPSPAINAYAKSKGEAVRVVAGATANGALFVVKPEINGPADLPGKDIATPQLGNTQDVALRNWLASQGLQTDLTGGGDVSIFPQENAQTLEAFREGTIDGAWVPEPWATRLILEGGGKVLVDETNLWPGGRFATTLLVVRTEFLEEHPSLVESLIRGLVRATDFVNVEHGARELVNVSIGNLAGSRLSDEVVDAAWRNLIFTYDPIARSVNGAAEHAVALGLLDPVELDGLFDLEALNRVLTSLAKPEVSI